MHNNNRLSSFILRTLIKEKMKVKLSKEQIQRIVENPEEAEKAKVSVSDPWWVIVVKVIAYVCGLLLAGACTTMAYDALR